MSSNGSAPPDNYSDAEGYFPVGFYLHVKGLEILQIAPPSNKDKPSANPFLRSAMVVQEWLVLLLSFSKIATPRLCADK